MMQRTSRRASTDATLPLAGPAGTHPKYLLTRAQIPSILEPMRKTFTMAEAMVLTGLKRPTLFWHLRQTRRLRGWKLGQVIYLTRESVEQLVIDRAEGRVKRGRVPKQAA